MWSHRDTTAMQYIWVVIIVLAICVFAYVAVFAG